MKWRRLALTCPPASRTLQQWKPSFFSSMMRLKMWVISFLGCNVCQPYQDSWKQTSLPMMLWNQQVFADSGWPVVRSCVNHSVKAMGMQFKEAQTCSVRSGPFILNKTYACISSVEINRNDRERWNNMKCNITQHYVSWTSCRRWWCGLLAGRTYCIQSSSSSVAAIASGL